MKPFSSIVTCLVVVCAFMDSSSGLECKELFERKEELGECCSAQPLLSMDGMQECFKQHADKDKMNQMGCGFKCFYDHHGVMDGDEVSEEKLLAKVEALEDGEWKETVTKTIKECTAKMGAMKAKMDEHGGPKGECSPSAGMMNMCLGKALFTSCPADKWNDSEVCNKAKSGECDHKGRKSH